jgi:hypothetical protein
LGGFLAMSKLLLLSILVATIALPARAATKSKNPKVGLKRALVHVAIFNAFYLFGLLYLYGRL